MGATSGLGRALAEKFINSGWKVGATGRNEEALENLRNLAPAQVEIARIDIMTEDASEKLNRLIEAMGGMDIYLHCSGIALLNEELNLESEVKICRTNAVGFTRMCLSAYRYFESTKQPGRLVAITSVAGTRGLESLPAYSASKAYDSTLLEALRQRADGQKLPLHIIDIKPGWTRTPLLEDDKKYMLEMDAENVSHLIFKAALNAKRSSTIGLRWKLITTLQRLVPSWLWSRIHIPLWKSIMHKP